MTSDFTTLKTFVPRVILIFPFGELFALLPSPSPESTGLGEWRGWSHTPCCGTAIYGNLGHNWKEKADRANRVQMKWRIFLLSSILKLFPRHNFSCALYETMEPSMFVLMQDRKIVDQHPFPSVLWHCLPEQSVHSSSTLVIILKSFFCHITVRDEYTERWA